MSTSTKYIDSSDFLTATKVYDDQYLTVVASDGFYQFDGEYREQVNGLLGPAILCEECETPAIPCEQGVTPPSGGQGLYNLTFDAGDDTGAVIIYFNPQSVPDGLRVLYDGVYYNAVASPTDGRIQSTSSVNGAFTILGNANNTCLPSFPDTTSYTYYDGFTGSTWNQGSPSPQDITITSGDNQGGGSNEYSTVIIPKPNATPNTIQLQVLGPCSGTAWNVDIDCPASLDSFSSSTNIGSSTDCTTSDQTYYFAQHLNGTNTRPIVTNWVFSDSNGSTVLTDGNYVMDDDNVITVVGGVVTVITSCTTPTLTSFLGKAIQGTDCDTSDTTYYHSGSGSYPVLNDSVFGDINGNNELANGNYYMDNDKVITVTSGAVSAIVDCTTPASNCAAYIASTSGSGFYTYTDCDTLQEVTENIGGASGFDQESFCAIQGSVTSSFDVSISGGGPCN